MSALDPVTIVGAGPAGLACAIALARAGRKVLVREWRAQVGQRFHGDFQGIENWSGAGDILEELRDAGIEPKFAHYPVLRLNAFDPDGNLHRLDSPRPICYVVRRGSEPGTLDRALLEQALATGVQVCFGDRVRTTDRGVVLAAGPRTADVIAVGYMFETDAADGDWMALGQRIAPLGYAYLLVHGGRGTLAVCLFSGFKEHARYLARAVDFFREKTGVVIRNARRFGGYGSVRLPHARAHGVHTVAGEQGGFQDALAGFGMRYALRSGLLAARSIVERSDYGALWREELLPWLRAGLVNRVVAAAVGEPGWRILMDYLGRGDARERLRRIYAPSALHRLLYPVARLCYRKARREPRAEPLTWGRA